MRDAFELAIEQHPLEYYKDELQKYQDELAQKQASKDAREAAKKNKKKTPAVIEDDDVDMTDAADEEVPEPKEKAKSKKRKAEEEAVSVCLQIYKYTNQVLTIIADSSTDRIRQEAKDQVEHFLYS